MDITSEQIKSARERRQMTQAELAEEVGVSLRTVGSWERGESVPRNRMGAVAEALGIVVEGERDYGQQAIKRRLGVLAKQRREQMGYGRVSFAKDSGIGSDSSVMDFEFAKRWPREATLRKFEAALGWKAFVTDEILASGQRASSIEMKDLDDPAVERDSNGTAVLRQFSTTQLLEELILRLGELKAREVAKSAGLGASTEQHHFDLAASDDHVEGEDEND